MRIFIVFFTVIFIFGCNVMSNPKKSNSNLQMPLKISTKIPEFLYSKHSKNTRKILIKDSESIGKKSLGFEITQDYIEFFLMVEEILVANNQITNFVFSDIKQKCSNIKEDEVCTISKNQIKFTLTEQILKKLLTDKTMADDLNATVGDEIAFGDIEFIKYSDKNNYNYAINIDFTNIIQKLYNEEDAVKILHSTSWSEDNKTVLSTLYLTDKDGVENSFVINFEKNDDLKEKMYLYHKSIDASNLSEGVHNFFITNTFDSLQSSTLLFNDIVIDENISVNALGYSSLVKINNKNGLQIIHIKDSIDTDKVYNYVSNDIINFKGTLLATTFCYEKDNICSIDDRQSWYTSTNDNSIFSPVEKYNKKVALMDISYNQLENGSYFFIPSSIYHDNISIKEVLSHKVGSFVVMKQKGHGLWNDTSYLNNIDSLTLLYSKYNENLDVSLTQKNGRYFKKIPTKYYQ